MNLDSARIAEEARKAFGRRKIMTLGEVAEFIQGSIHTARRRLRQWLAANSYNLNGRYYTLPDVPEFDGNGLWRWRGAFFSRHGNLRQTVVALVERSPAGLDAGELGALVGLAPRSFLSAFAADPRLMREKVHGRFVYYGAASEVHAAQRRRRCASLAASREVTPAEGVAILVEKIKNPASGDEALSRQLRKQKIQIDAATVHAFLALHGLAEKKTPRSA